MHSFDLSAIMQQALYSVQYKEYGRATKPYNSFYFCDFSGVYSPLCTSSPLPPPTEEKGEGLNSFNTF